ncbi:MAG: AAA family ATPase [Luteimonas sp.]|nr:AAA family ATPase [Luteimonas sp.]
MRSESNVAQLKPAPEPRKLVTFTRLDQIEAKPLDAIVDGWVYADTLGCTIGKSGSCKSFFMQGVVPSIALGVPYMGLRVKAGAVFYLGGEGLGGIRKRFDGWAKYTGLDLTGAPIYVASGLPSLADEINAVAVRDEILEVAEQLFFEAGSMEPALVVVDTVARAMAGADENSAADMGRLIGAMDIIRSQFRCAVELIHHTGHGENTRERARGSSALYAAMDAERLVTSDGGMVTVRSTKQKDWSKPADLFLDRHVVEVDIGEQRETTLVLDKACGPGAAEQARQLRMEVVRLKADGVSIRGIAGELGISKSKVEHELAMHAKASRYEEASRGA